MCYKADKIMYLSGHKHVNSKQHPAPAIIDRIIPAGPKLAAPIDCKFATIPPLATGDIHDINLAPNDPALIPPVPKPRKFTIIGIPNNIRTAPVAIIQRVVKDILKDCKEQNKNKCKACLQGV